MWYYPNSILALISESIMSHIFISYSKKNRVYARKMADKLLSEGYDIWIDDRIDYGEDWWDIIEQAIETCSAFVVIMTSESKVSKWVKREVMYADELNKPLFPLLLEGKNWALLIQTHYVDVTSGELPVQDYFENLERHGIPRKKQRGIDVTDLTLTPVEVSEVAQSLPQTTELMQMVVQIEDKAPPMPAISPEVQQLLDLIAGTQTQVRDRVKAGQKLAQMGDPRPGVGLYPDGTPHVDWVDVPAGEFWYGEGKNQKLIKLPAFKIARYPVTYIQFQAFVNALDGYRHPGWWKGLARREEVPGAPRSSLANAPRDSVNWYEAMAFARWLNAKYQGLLLTSEWEIRLPIEREWEKAARGPDGRIYPWGNVFKSENANVNDTKADPKSFYVGETTAVGIYAMGESPYGVQDMSGNVWEWCLTDYSSGSNSYLNTEDMRVVRGGSWCNNAAVARASFRNGEDPGYRYHAQGFRVVAFNTTNINR
jgi:formylglycine-generating enzyme required for sulfatase activity